jgi:hypothetical protein
MPCELIVDRNLRAIHSRYYGNVTLDDVLQQRRQMTAHPEFDPDLALIINLSDATRVALSAADIETIAKSSTPVNRLSRHIFVAPRPDMYGLARMYQAFGEDIHPNVTIVKTLDEAKTLLAG